MAEEEIGARLSLKDRRKFSAEAATASRDVDKIGDSAGKSKRKMGVAGKAVLGIMGGIAIGAAGLAAASANAWRQVDNMTDTIRVGTGATGAALDGLVASAQGVAGKVPAAYDDVATAVADLNTRLGLTGKPLEDMSAQFLELSRITGTDVATNVASMTRVFGDWGISADKQAGALDQIFKASQSTGAGVDSLAQSVVQFGAPLRQMGFSFEESLAMFGKWEKEGVNATLVMGGMRQALGKMAKAGEDAPTAFRRISGEIAAMEDPSKATGLAMELFGARAGPDMAAAIREGRFAIDETLAAITGGSETIMQAGADTQDYAEKWLMLKNRVTPALSDMAVGVMDFAEGVMGFIGQSGSIAGFGVALGGLFGWEEDSAETDKLITTLEDLWATAKSVFGGISTAVGTMGGAAKDVFGFLTSDSLASQATLVTFGVIAGAVLIGQTILWTQAGLAAIKSGVLQARAWLMARLGAIQTGAVLVFYYALTVAGWIGMGLTAIAQGAIIAARWAMMGARAAASGIVMLAQGAIVVGSWILMGITAMASGLMMAAAWLLGLGPIGLAIAALVLIGAAFVILWKKSETFRNIVKGALSAVGGAAVATKDAIVGAFNTVVNFFSNLRMPAISWDGIKNGFKSAVNWIIDKWNGLSFGIPSIDTNIPGIGKVGGFTLNTPNIPRLHTGGTVARGGAVNMLPGEEIVILPPAATVVPMSDNVRSMAADMGGGGSKRPTVLQVVLDRKVLAEAVYDHTGDKVART